MKVRWQRVLMTVIALVFMVFGTGIFTEANQALAAENVKVHFKCETGTPSIFYWNVDGKYNNPVKWCGMQRGK